MFPTRPEPGCLIAKPKSAVCRRKSAGGSQKLYEDHERSGDDHTSDAHTMLTIGHRPSSAITGSRSSSNMLIHWQSVISKRQTLEAQCHRETWQRSKSEHKTCRSGSVSEHILPQTISMPHRRVYSCMSSVPYKREGLVTEKKEVRKSPSQHMRPKTAMNMSSAFAYPLHKNNLILADSGGKWRILSANAKVNLVQDKTVITDALPIAALKTSNHNYSYYNKKTVPIRSYAAPNFVALSRSKGHVEKVSFYLR